MIQRCEIPIPPSANHMHRMVRPKQGRPFLASTAEYKAWTQQAGMIVKCAWCKVKRYPVRIRILVNGGKGFPESRDLDNCWKPIIDMIRHAGIIVNDRVKEVASIVANYLPAESKGAIASCWITIEEIET